MVRDRDRAKAKAEAIRVNRARDREKVRARDKIRARDKAKGKTSDLQGERAMSGMDSAAKTAEEIKEELSGGEKSPEETVAELDEPKMKEEYTFDFNYMDVVGREHSGKFTNKILSIDQINQVGVIRAGVCGNVPIAALDNSTLDNSEMLAHLTVSLTKRPKWAAQLGALKDPEILRRLYVEVSSHEDTFHGRGEDQKAGAGGKGDAPG